MSGSDKTGTPKIPAGADKRGPAKKDKTGSDAELEYGSDVEVEDDQATVNKKRRKNKTFKSERLSGAADKMGTPKKPAGKLAADKSRPVKKDKKATDRKARGKNKVQ